MNDCCSSPNDQSSSSIKKPTCPVSSCNELKYPEVSSRTLLHHVKKPWQASMTAQNYYFCQNKNCDVVYFGEDNSTISRDQLRTKVGVKESDDDALVCYCFGVSFKEAKANTEIKQFVTEQTKNGTCSCSTFNPSGKCCLKDFPRFK